jgi:hypothetical protein
LPEYAPNPCCREDENIEDGPGPRGMDGLGEPRDDVKITHCRLCECRHLEAEADPVQIGVDGAPL